MKYTEEMVLKQRHNRQLLMDKFYSEIDNTKLSPRAKMIATAIVVNRGVHNDLGHLFVEVRAVDERNHPLILKALGDDIHSATKENVTQAHWSGLGKTNGIEVYAVLSKYASTPIMDRFFELRTMKTPDKKKSVFTMKQVTKRLLEEFGFDVKKAL